MGSVPTEAMLPINKSYNGAIGKHPQVRRYIKKDENLRIGSIELSRITYHYYMNELFHIVVEMNMEMEMPSCRYSKELADALSKKYQIELHEEEKYKEGSYNAEGMKENISVWVTCLIILEGSTKMGGAVFSDTIVRSVVEAEAEEKYKEYMEKQREKRIEEMVNEL